MDWNGRDDDGWGKSLNKGITRSLLKSMEEDEEERQAEDIKKALTSSSEEENKDKRGWFQKAWDQINVVDNSRTFKRAEPGEGNKKNTAEQLGDVGRTFFKNTAQFANTAAEGVRESVEFGRGIAGEITGNVEARDEAIRRANEDSLLDEGRGLLGVGGAFTKEELDNMTPKELAKVTAGSGLGVAGEILPGTAAVRGASLTSRAAKAAAEGGLLGGSGALGEEILDDEKGVNLGRVGTGVAGGAVLGTAADSAFSALARRRNGGQPETPGQTQKQAAEQQLDNELGVSGSAKAVADEMDARDAMPEPQRQLGAGYRDVDTIQDDLRRVQNGEDESLFRYADSQGNDVTSQIADFDREIGARKAAIRDLRQQTDVTNPPEGVDPSTYTGDAMSRANAAEGIAKLEDEIATLTAQQEQAFQSLGGVQRTIDTDAARARFGELREELNASQSYQDNLSDGFATRNNINADDARVELDNINNGSTPDNLRVDTLAPQTIEEVALLDSMPTNIKEIATTMQAQKIELQAQRSALMAEDNAELALASADADYFARKADIDNMSPARQEIELPKLEEENLARVAEIEEAKINDADAVAALDEQIFDLSLREAEVLTDVEMAIRDNPGLFRESDPVAVQSRTERLERTISDDDYIKKTNPNQSETTNVLVDAVERDGNIDYNNPAVAKAANDDVGITTSIAEGNSKSPGIGTLLTGPLEYIKNFGPAGREVSETMTDAMQDKLRHIGVATLRFKEWDKALDGKASRERVFKSLDGEDVGLNETETLVRNEIREYYNDMADALGIPKENRIGNYINHIFKDQYGKDADEIGKSMLMLKNGIDENGKKLSKRQLYAIKNELDSRVDPQTLAYVRQNNAWKVENGFLKKRSGQEGYERDLLNALMTYETAAANKIFLEPAMKKSMQSARAFNKEQGEYLTKWFDKINRNERTSLENTVNSVLDPLFKTSGSMGKAMRGWRRVSSLGTMGGSITTALKTFQDSAKNFGEFSTRDFMGASAQAMKALKPGSATYNELVRSGVLQDTAIDLFSGRLGGRHLTKAENALWTGLRTADRYNRAVSYYAGKNRYLQKAAKEGKDVNNPKVLELAEKEGLRMSDKINFRFSDETMPPAWNNEIGKSAIHIQTFNMQQANYMKNMLKGEDPSSLFVRVPGTDNYKLSPKGAWAVTKTIGATAAFFATIGTAIGMSKEELVPFWSDVSDGNMPQSPLMGLLIGKDGQPGLTTLMGDAKDKDWDKLKENSTKFGSKLGWMLVPGGSQIRRTKGGLEAAEKGYSEVGSGKNKGNVAFMQSQDPTDKLRAALFGKYSTKEGQDYIKGGFPSLSSKEMALGDKERGVNFKDISRENQDMYYQFYTAAKKVTGEEDARKKVTELSKASKHNAAARIAEEYNQQALATLKEQLSGAQLSDDILEQIQKDILIEPLNYKKRYGGKNKKR